MRKARAFVLARGGAARANVFTRIALALFGAVPWRAVPAMPIEIMLLPRWFPFHLAKVSYWSRTVIVPLLILMALKPQARNPARHRHPGTLRDAARSSSGTTSPTARATRSPRPSSASTAWCGRSSPASPKISRDRALKAAVDFMTERLNGEEGLGAIFPAMANAVMAMDALGYAADDPAVVTAKRALKRLLITTERGTTHCQPCLSPVWDTALAMHAMMEAGEPPDGEVLDAAARWLLGARDHRREGRLGLEPAGRRPERLGLPVRQPPLPGYGRHGRGRHGAAPHRPGAAPPGDRAGRALDRRDAERGRRLGRLRRRQHQALPQPHPLRRPRRAARSADGGRDRPLPRLPDPDRLRPRPSGDPARRRLPQGRAGAGRLVVRPLGRELRLRHLVGALRPQRGRREPAIAGASAARWTGSKRASATTAAGARTSPPTGSTAATRPRPPRPPRPPGRCSA